MTPTTVVTRLHIAGMSKTFGPNRVLDNVSLSISAGEIHCLVGHNGSGKSTLVKILAGLHAPDSGAEITVDGMPLRLPSHARELAAYGVAFVHQDLGLVDGLSVADNCRVGQYSVRRLSRRIDAKAELDLVRSALARLDSDIDPRRLVRDLGSADRTTVALVRALQTQTPGRGLLVLDEATRALPRPAQEHLYHLTRAFAAAGGAVLMITHHIREVFAVADRVTVLRDGRVAAHQVSTAEIDQEELARLLVGRRASAPTGAAPGPIRRSEEAMRGFPAIRVTGLSGRQLSGLCFEVAPGEIVGVTGLLDSGFDELPALMTGARSARGPAHDR